MEHQKKAQENPPTEVELTRKEMADLFGVSGETIKRRTAEGYLKPVAENSRVLRYGETDIQSMVKMGYRLDSSIAQTYNIPACVYAEKPSTFPPTTEKSEGLSGQEKDTDLFKLLKHYAQDPAAKSIMMRFFATMILQDDLN